MIEWKYFSKRRGVTLESFSSLSYKEYRSWCVVRGVMPLCQEDWPYSNEQVEIPKTQSDLPDWSYKSLNKNKKAVLASLAKQYQVHLDGTETKREIINLLLGLNN